MSALGKAIVSFYRDGCTTMAAALSYFSLLSLLPLLTVIISVLGRVFGRSQLAYRWTLSLIRAMIPGFDVHLVDGLNRALLRPSGGFWAMAALLWMALQVFVYLERAMNRIFKAPSRFGILRSFWVSLLLLLGAGLFTLLSVLLTFTVHGLRRIQPGIDGGGFSPIGRIPLFVHLLPVLLMFFAVSLIYWAVPNRRVHWRHASSAGAIVALLMEGAKQLFGWYVLEVADFAGIYGSLTAVILFLLWVYYSSALLFLGGEWVFHLEKFGPERPSRRRRKERA